MKSVKEFTKREKEIRVKLDLCVNMKPEPHQTMHISDGNTNFQGEAKKNLRKEK